MKQPRHIVQTHLIACAISSDTAMPLQWYKYRRVSRLTTGGFPQASLLNSIPSSFIDRRKILQVTIVGRLFSESQVILTDTR